MNKERNFSKFGKPFQEKVFQGMLTDTAWSAQMIEVVDPEYFERLAQNVWQGRTIK